MANYLIWLILKRGLPLYYVNLSFIVKLCVHSHNVKVSA